MRFGLIEATSLGVRKGMPRGGFLSAGSPVLLCPYERSDNDVPPCLDPAVGPQQYAVPETILEQHAMHFRQTL